jgi:hypothetical protein
MRKVCLFLFAAALPFDALAEDTSPVFGAEINHIRAIANSARDGGPCPPSDNPETPHVCLTDGGRFSSAVTFGAVTSDGPEFLRAKPTAIEALPDSAALWYFYDQNNPEILIKLLNGCEINGYWWLFGAASTDRAWQVYVWDLHDVRDGIAQGTVWSRYGEGPTYSLIEGTNGYQNHNNLLTDTEAIPCVVPDGD